MCSAVKIYQIGDSSELHGLQFTRVLRGKFMDYEYEPVSDNDNHLMSEAA